MSITTVNVAPGFHSDVCKLLEAFSETPEIRMNDFTRIWRKMKFLKIFLYREGRELILFTEECFRILLRLILSEQPVQFRVGAFYCLYSIYIMQPSKPKVKIRLVPETWKGFQSLIEESQLEPWENEIKFAFWTLAYQNAFFYVAKQNSAGLVTTSNEGEGLESTNFNSAMEDYMNTDHQFIKEVHERYMDLKNSLSTSTTRSVELVEKDPFTSVERDIQALQKKFNIGSSVSTQQSEECSQSDYEPSEESDEPEVDDDDTLERRRKVRMKQLTTHVQQSKSRRHRETEVPDETSKTVKKSKGRPRGAKSFSKKNKALEEQESERPFQGLATSVEEQD